MTTIQDILDGTRDTYTVGRVFGDPIEKDGVTVVPVAVMAGGGGGGSGPVENKTDKEATDGVAAERNDAAAEASGGGFGGMARPAGVYVIRGENVEWMPAVDANRLAMAGIALAALITVVLGLVLRRH
jgi:uncharacterized spore protein YtfJ